MENQKTTMGGSEAVADLLKKNNKLREEAKRYILNRDGVLDLDEYITPKRYCDRFGIKSVQTVHNWIARGVIPADNVKVIEELNGLRLIKAVPYK